MTRPRRRALVVWMTVDVLRGTRWGAWPSLLYGDNVAVHGGCYIDKASGALQAFLADPAGYELGIINCVTGATIHHLDPHAPGSRISRST